MIARLLLGTAAAALALAAPVAAQDFVITNATVATGDGSEPVENATVVVREGRIVAAGTGVSIPAGVERIDGTGKWVTPGIFSAVTDLGLSDVDGVSDSNDSSAGNSPFSAALDVSTALNPNSQDVLVARADGITRASVYSSPSASIFGGQGAVIDLGADPEMVTRTRAFQIVDLGERGARISGGSRTSAHALLRNALREARDYGNRGMAAYSELQQAEFDSESAGYTATRHQREAGTSYFDAVSLAISGGKSSTTAMAGSTETGQFSVAERSSEAA